MSKRKDLEYWYMDAFDEYGEALQNYVQNFWQEEYGEEFWEEFHDLDKKLKVKFYYEDEE